MKKFIAACTAVAALSGAPQAAQAQDRWVGQIVMGGWNFCPRSTAQAAGQLLSISQYQTLFSLYGTLYGGDGRTTFGLPDLRGRSPIGYGQGPGLPSYAQGHKGGAPQSVLSVDNLAPHSHAASGNMNGVPTPGNVPLPAGNFPALSQAGNIYGSGSPVAMAAGSITVTTNNAGSGTPFNNMPPYQAINYCVVLDGVYPSRS